MSFIYFVQAGQAGPFQMDGQCCGASFAYSMTKIGHAKNPIKRIGMIQTGNPHKLACVRLLECGQNTSAERLFHLFFSDRRAPARNEWFSLRSFEIERCFIDPESRAAVYIHFSDGRPGLIEVLGTNKHISYGSDQFNRIITAYYDNFNRSWFPFLTQLNKPLPLAPVTLSIGERMVAAHLPKEGCLAHVQEAQV